MENGLKFAEAMQELQAIVRKMENDDVDIDALATHVRRAQDLVAACKYKLLKTEEEVKKLTQEE